MPCFQPDNNMLIISNDSFIIGLLTGYCVANHFTLKCISRSKPLYTNGSPPMFKLIIIDLREMDSALIEDHLESLNTIHSHYSIPICAIHNRNRMPLHLLRPWLDYYKDETFIEKLEPIVNKYSTLCTDGTHAYKNPLINILIYHQLMIVKDVGRLILVIILVGVDFLKVEAAKQ